MRGSSGLPVVSRFESDLLTILQGFLGHLPKGRLLALLAKPAERPQCLSRTAIGLVQDTLAKGATIQVAREGWWHSRFLREGRIASGRLWQRTTPTALGMAFSPLALDFLIWATSVECNKKDAQWNPPDHRELAIGDRWLLALAYQSVRNSEIGKLWIARRPWTEEALIRLLFTADFAGREMIAAADFAPWLAPPGVAVLESWQRRMADAWVAMELAKRELPIERLGSIASRQNQVLGAFLHAIDSAGRRDLSRFLLVAMGRLLQLGAFEAPLKSAQQAGMRLADRQQAHRDTLVLPGQLARLTQWQSEAMGCGYFDEGYQAAQLWKSDWEAYNGDRLAQDASRLLAANPWV